MEQIIDEAFEVLERTGVLMGNKEGAKLLGYAGIKILRPYAKGVVISITCSLVEQLTLNSKSDVPKGPFTYKIEPLC